MPYYTKAGDQGKTCVIGGDKVGKDDLRLEALGCFDEINCCLGLVSSFTDDVKLKNTVTRLQDNIHTACADIASFDSPLTPRIKPEHVDELEKLIESVEAIIGEQKKFVIPGGTKTAALLHLSRAVTRRAERALVRLSKESAVNSELLRYTNRLSSALIVLSMLENRKKGLPEKNPEYR